MIKINDVYSSIQGEGGLTGTPMIVLRLQGCTVGCSWCDTKQTWHFNTKPKAGVLEVLGENESWAECEESEIADYCKAIAGNEIEWVMLTGGEPAEQDLNLLVDSLKAKGFRICLETSGTKETQGIEKIDWVCVSPKFGFKEPLEEVIKHANEIKTVICTVKDLQEHLDQFIRWKNQSKRVSLQPVSGSKSALSICSDAAVQYGFYLSIQLHKLVGIS